MQITRITTKPAETSAEAVVVGVHYNHPLEGAAAEIDRAAGGLISKLVERKEISGKACEIVPLFAPAGAKSPLVVVVGCGEHALHNRSVAFRTAAAASRYLAGKERATAAFLLDDRDDVALAESAVTGAIVGCQGQDLYRAEKKRFPIAELQFPYGEAGITSGRVLGESVNLTRHLVNEPPQEIYPESFARRAEETAKAAGLEIEIWDEKRLEAERCGSLLAVAKGSPRPPRLVMLRHNGGKKGDAPLALVGKGVTFDSGGLSLKPSEGMLTMKCDMAGGATVLGAMSAIARLKLPVNVIGMIGLVENMPSGTAFKLGDVLHARNGRTIEVHNTDAEGRLVLADVLAVAVDLGVAKIIDLATLTGACVVALGNDVAGLMTNDQAWCDTLRDAALACGEPVWQLPMFNDYRLTDYGDLIRSEVADIKNVGEGRWGGAITAAKFLEEFVAGKPWTHMDIAGPAFAEKPKPWLDAGASGMYVRTLVDVARGMK